MSNIDTQIKNIYAQEALEQAATLKGATDFAKRQDKLRERGDISRTTAAQVIINTIFPTAMDAIDRAFKTAAPAARASLSWGEKLGAKTCALITLNQLFNAVGKKSNVVAGRISRQIRAELQAKALEEGHPGLAHYVYEQIKKSRSAKHRAAVLSRAKTTTGTPDLADMGFTDEVLESLGLKLIDAVVSSTGAFVLNSTIETKAGQSKSAYLIEITPEVQAAMRVTNERVQWMAPVRPVMLTPPRAWDASLSGGYLTEAQRLEFLKGTTTDYLADTLEEGKLDRAMSAMNTLQNTGYRINKAVLAVLLEAWDRDLPIGCIPQKEPKAIPAMPVYAPDSLPKEERDRIIDTFKAQHPDEWKAWKKEAAAVYAFNESGERVSVLLDIDKLVSMAKDHADYEAFYLPVQLDFRGRMYYVPGLLNPQTNDVAKGLLEFSRGVPLTEEGARSLAIAGATMWANGGLDKTTMEAREQWVYENDGIIRACARDPLGNLWWTEADKGGTAWSFLAFCIEWNNWRTHGEGYESHIILFADGKCNGSQHHAALLRDQQTAQYVCMLPMNLPDDFYTRVLERVNERVEQAQFDDTPLRESKEDGDESRPVYTVAQITRLIKGTLKRVHVKRGSMTYGYGVTLLGIREQLKTDKNTRPYIESFPKEVRKDVVAWLAQNIFDAVEETALASAACMKFLKGVGKVMAAHGLPVNWTTPDGFMAQQAYEKFDSIRVKSVLSGGTRVRIDKTEQVRRQFFTDVYDAVLTVLGNKAGTTRLVDELKEMLSYGVFRGITQHYRELFTSGRLDAFGEYAEKTVADVLVGDYAPMVDAVTEILMQSVVSAHDHFEAADGTMRITVSKPTGKLDESKNSSALAPNFVHSLDATHCRMTVNACAAEGIVDFAAVHDSFGTHAENYATMNRILREQFVAMYESGDHLLDLVNTCKQSLPVEAHAKLDALVAALPARGSFDIRQVLNAVYFFA